VCRSVHLREFGARADSVTWAKAWKDVAEAEGNWTLQLGVAARAGVAVLAGLSARPGAAPGPLVRIRDRRPRGRLHRRSHRSEHRYPHPTTTFKNTDPVRGVAATGAQPAGYIGLQSYPSAPVAFRRIELKP
jgi:hypothetical protein